MAKPLQEFARFIWWMQTQRQGGRQPSGQANRLGLWVCQKEMAATVRIHHRHLLLLSPRADTHFTVPRMVECWIDLGAAVRVCSMCLRLHIAVAVVINNCPRWDSNLGPLTPQSEMLPIDHCDTAVVYWYLETACCAAVWLAWHLLFMMLFRVSWSVARGFSGVCTKVQQRNHGMVNLCRRQRRRFRITEVTVCSKTVVHVVGCWLFRHLFPLNKNILYITYHCLNQIFTVTELRMCELNMLN